MQAEQRTRLPSQESHHGNSTSGDESGDNRALAAFTVTLVVIGGDGVSDTVRVTVGGLDAGDAARRAKWQTVRDRGVTAAQIRVVGAQAAA